MSTLINRYHSLTVSYLPTRRERSIQQMFKNTRIRLSSRRAKRVVRSILTRKINPPFGKRQ